MDDPGPTELHLGSPVTIVSGGQTGADRAALDFAISHRLEHGGWCPRGRRAEDGTIPACYLLRETNETSYAARTERNIIDSDATVVFSMSTVVRGGTLLSMRLARRHNRPLLHLTAAVPVAEAAARLARFLRDHQVRVLNVAGPRASQEPAIGALVKSVLSQALTRR
jgi:hypothetical protein